MSEEERALHPYQDAEHVMSPRERVAWVVGRSEWARCRCLTPVGTQCMAKATQEDRLCDGCREGGDGHWCERSQTPDTEGAAHV